MPDVAHSVQVFVPGVRLGKYEIVRKLAYGGMAEIALARATGIEGFEKLVVLKRILPQYAENERYIGMFLDEARLAATLEHPNIAHVYDIGRDQGSYFFAMEYVQGQDVRHILKACKKSGQPLPLEQAIHIVLGVAAGLHHAHDKIGPDGRPLSIVHRDVSPSNVLVTYDGAVKLVDFGIAKARSRQTETRAGTLKGKIAYMSPEQCRGEPLDRRSDVFSIGILLYELTTGTRPFRGETEFAVLNQIATKDVVPPSSCMATYPRGLENIVLRALQRDRDMRYGTAQELQIALEHFAREQRLAISAVALARTMRELFPAEVTASHVEKTLALSGTERLGYDANGLGTALESECETVAATAVARRHLSPRPTTLSREPSIPPEPSPPQSFSGSTHSSVPFPPMAPLAEPTPELRPRRHLGPLAISLGLLIVVGALLLVRDSYQASGAQTTLHTEAAPVALPRVETSLAPAPVATSTESLILAAPTASEKPAADPPARPRAIPTRQVAPSRRAKASSSKGRNWDPDSALPPPAL
jgi:serine/threonine protein kinase